MNTWNPEHADCAVPQDHYDPDRENTLDYEMPYSGPKKEDFQLNTWRDVFCLKTRVYYEAQIKQVKESKRYYNKRSVLFHIVGVGKEWIDAESDRIQPHNLYTEPSRLSKSKNSEKKRKSDTDKVAQVERKGKERRKSA